MSSPGGKGNKKGAAFEREMCRRLSYVVSNGKNRDLFWRSSMSGGRSTMQFNKTGQAIANQSGDFSAIGILGMKFMEEFSVECKFYKDIEVHKLLYGGMGGVRVFWQQCVEDAERVSRHPLLFVKQNNRPVLVGSNSRGLMRLFKLNGLQAIFPRFLEPVMLPAQGELCLFHWEKFEHHFAWEPYDVPNAAAPTKRRNRSRNLRRR